MTDQDLQALEAAKWRPSSLGSERFIALFADDFVSVEYGANPFGGVTRVTDAKSILTSGGADTLIQMLELAAFEMSEWRIADLGPEARLISYRIAAPAMNWSAYATSVWKAIDDRWQTVFYQASRTD